MSRASKEACIENVKELKEKGQLNPVMPDIVNRKKAGKAGREYCLREDTMLSAKNMGGAFKKSMGEAFEKWEPIKQFKVYEV